jgi:hypothetical protein
MMGFMLQCMSPVMPWHTASNRCGAKVRTRSGEADMPMRSEAGRSDENDPTRKWSVHRSGRDDGGWVGPVFEAAAMPSIKALV